MAIATPNGAPAVLDRTEVPAPQVPATPPLDAVAGAPSAQPQPVPNAYLSSWPSAPSAVASPTMVQQTAVNVNVGMPTIEFHAARQGHGLFMRALWFVCVGWWLSAFTILAGYALVASVIFLPLGLWFLHRVPQAQTLRSRTREFTTQFRDGAIVFTEGTVTQVAWYWRLLYLPVGVVVGAVWLVAAWFLGVLVVTLPLSIWMIDRAPGIITLQRH